MREQGLYSFPGLGKGDECGIPVFLIETVRTFKSDVCRLEKIKLYICSDISFVAKIVCVLRGTESEVRSPGKIPGPSHPAKFPHGYPANLYRLGIYNKEVFSAIHPIGESLTDFFTQSVCLLPAVIELSAGNKIGNSIPAFL